MSVKKLSKYIAMFQIISMFFLYSGLHAQNAEKKMENIKTEEKIDSEVSKETTPAETSNSENNNEVMVDKGTSLFSTIKMGGPLMFFIVILGLVSLTIIIERIIFYSRNGIWKVEHLEEYLNIAADGSKAKFKEDLEDDLRNAFQLYSNSLERGLALLSGIGNISPIVGFLGTVIGMISAFASIAAATTVNAKVVAVGIQMALVTTAGGLVVAAPTLAVFYFFTHVVQLRYVRAEEIIDERSEKLPRISQKLGKK